MTATSLPSPVLLTPERRERLVRLVRVFVGVTITYNLVEAVIAISAGTVAGSTALVGFGLDSVIEVSSAAAVAWQFSARDHAVRDARERATLRVISLSFFALAAYVVVEAVRALAGGDRAAPSTVGVVLAAVSLLVMPGLSYTQRRAGREIGSATAVADSKQNPAVYVPVGGAPGRAAAQRAPRVGLGRPDRGVGHCGRRCEGGPSGVAR